MSNKPVLFLAFANDLRPDGVYLPSLSREANEVRGQLDRARKAGLCDLVVRTGVSAEEVLSVFGDPEYRNRIALFHYAGHAEDYLLLLQEGVGESATADARGLAAFLKGQHALQIVFLNACATREQVQYLLDAGISTVIATSQLIEDTLATDFAIQFYTSLANGVSVQRAFDEAKGAIQFKHSDLVAQLQAQPDAQLDHFADGLPWALYSSPGAEVALQWNLPQAAGDPLFGLPPLPALDLPDEPYRYLSWYERQQAELFFGRGSDIRKLYDAATAADGSPLILLYGQSGVGKSSLLAAGLTPRLESSQSVRYVRRTMRGGLVAALQEGITGENKESKSQDELRAWWVAQETNAGKPLTVIVDQVEEVFTQAATANPNEMSQFVEALQAIFRERTQRPQGKLILGFRKEWQPEIEQLLSEAKLPRSAIFLDRMDRNGIIESVLGPSRSPRLQQRYGLQVDESVSGVIADDLLEDRDSPVAPTLQTLLSKLWRRAKEANGSRPGFTLDLYQSLKREGILLGDFLDQQIEEIRRWNAVAVDSGLQLDLLTAHTTERGTSAQHTKEELLKLYAGEHGLNVSDLIEQNCEKRLLVDPAGEGAATTRATRLVHDTLAPLVRERYEKSDKPGQRARRILENRAVDWQEGQTGAALDEADLKAVEAGQAGMRAWTEAEKRLIDASRQARSERQRTRRQLRFAGLAAVAAILLFAILAVWQWQQSTKRGNQIAALATTGAEQAGQVKALATESQDRNTQLQVRATSEARLRQTSDQRLEQALINESKRLANLSLQQLSVDPVASVNLAIAALPEAGRERPYLAEAEFALAEAVHTVQEEYYLPVKYLHSAEQVAIHDQTIAVGGDGLYLIDLSSGKPISTFLPTNLSLNGVGWSKDGLLLGYEHTTLHVWQGTTEIATQEFPSEKGIACARWNPQRDEIAICDEHTIRIWSPANSAPPRIIGDIDAANNSDQRDLAWSPNGRWLAAWGAQFLLWDTQTNTIVYSDTQENDLAYLQQAQWSPSGTTLAFQWQGLDEQNGSSSALILLTPSSPPITTSVAITGGLFGWKLLSDQDLATWQVQGDLDLRRTDGTIRWSIPQVAFATIIANVVLARNDFSLLVLRSDGQAEIRYLEHGTLLATLGEHIIQGVWSPSGTHVATVGSDSTIKIWDGNSGILWTTLAGHESQIADLRWFGENRLLSITKADVSNGLPGTLRLWNLFDGKGQFNCIQSDNRTTPFCNRYSQPIELALQTDRADSVNQMTWNGNQTVQVMTNRGAFYTMRLDAQQAISLPAEIVTDRLVVTSPDGEKLLTYQDGIDGQFWQRGQQGWHSLDTLAGPIHDVQWTTNGLLISSTGGAVDLVEPTSLARTQLLTETGLLQAIAVGNTRIALSNQTGRIYLYTTDSKQLTPLSSRFAESGAMTLDAAADGSYLAAGNSLGVTRWAINHNNQVDEVSFTVNGFDQSKITLSPDGRFVAVAQDGYLVVLDMQENRELIRKNINNALLMGVKWSQDGSRLLSWDDASAWLFRWESQTSKMSPILHIERKMFSPDPVLSPDGLRLLAIDPFNNLRLWKVWRDPTELINDARSCCLTRPLSPRQRQEFGLE